MKNQIAFEQSRQVQVSDDEIHWQRSADAVEIYWNGFPAPISVNGKRVVLVPSKKYKGWPKTSLGNPYHGTVMAEALIKYSLKEYGHLIPKNTMFRISLLGQIIKERAKDENLGDVCLINGAYLSPFVIESDGTIHQI